MNDGSMCRDHTRPISVTHICNICSISVVSGHWADLFVISWQFKAIPEFPVIKGPHVNLSFFYTQVSNVIKYVLQEK